MAALMLPILAEGASLKRYWNAPESDEVRLTGNPGKVPLTELIVRAIVVFGAKPPPATVTMSVLSYERESVPSTPKCVIAPPVSVVPDDDKLRR
jgi:hypothetical protein